VREIEEDDPNGKVAIKFLKIKELTKSPISI
jgi:hypothetical protein